MLSLKKHSSYGGTESAELAATSSHYNIRGHGESWSQKTDLMAPKMDRKKTIWGVLIVVGIALSWAASTQFTQQTQTSQNYKNPFSIIYFSTTWNILLFPVFSLMIWGRLMPYASVRKALQEQSFPLEWTNRRVFFTVILFYAMWAVTNYAYTLALDYTTATDVTAIFSTAPAFVYIFSIIFFGEKLRFVKVVAVLFAVGGVCLVALVSTPNRSSDNWWLGGALSLFSAVGAAAYKTGFKLALEEANAVAVSAFLGLLGLFNLTVMWMFVVFLYQMGIEQPLDDIPWDYMVISAVFALVFNFFINFGITLTYPLFIAIGTVLGIPVNVFLDAVWHGHSFHVGEIVGTVLIIISFILLLVPNEYQPKEVHEYLNPTNLKKKTIDCTCGSGYPCAHQLEKEMEEKRDTSFQVPLVCK